MNIILSIAQYAIERKALKKDETASVNDVIIIGDDNSRGNEDSMKIDRMTNDWTKIGCYVLSRAAERDMLCNNEWLTDMHINAVQVLIRN